jgi:hypothetical protein
MVARRLSVVACERLRDTQKCRSRAVDPAVCAGDRGPNREFVLQRKTLRPHVPAAKWAGIVRIARMYAGSRATINITEKVVRSAG